MSFVQHPGWKNVNMKIATFNCNSLRKRLPVILDWLKTNQPDIMAIQETKVQDKDFPAEAISAAGYNIAYKGEKSYNGVALLSKESPEDVIYTKGGNSIKDEARFISAKIGNMHIINTYVPQGRSIDHPMYQYKKEWLKDLKKWFSKNLSPKANILWIGDMNVARCPIDVYKPETKQKHVCFHKEIRDIFNENISFGFTDIFRKHNPNKKQYSYFDYRIRDSVSRNIGWRIDYILATSGLSDKSAGSYIDLTPRKKPGASDHTVLAAEFREV
jgi:exodeoxyribonuclease III